MLTLSKHTATVFSESGLTYLSPKSIDVNIEETWSPYIQASMVIKSALFSEELDPRDQDRLKLRLHQAFGELLEVNQLTYDFGGNVAAVTAKYSPVIPRSITNDYTRPWNAFEPGLPISHITASYGGDVSDLTAAFAGDVSDVSKFIHGTGSFNPQPSTVFEADLGIRAIERNYLTGETTVRLSSDEAILQDFAHTSVTPYIPGTTDVRTLVNYVLGLIGATLESSAVTGTFDNTDVEWQAGESGWDFLNPIVQKADLVLYCNEAREWHLVEAGAISGELELSDTNNVTQLQSSLDRSTDYFDSCVIEYVWNDGTTQRKEYDIYAPSGSNKTYKITYNDTPYPGNGAAQALTQRALTRGETYSVDAVSNYDARPRQELTVDVTGEPLKAAVTSSIRWSLPSARMAITVRDLEEII
jgi:hypothetical protein